MFSVAGFRMPVGLFLLLHDQHTLRVDADHVAAYPVIAIVSIIIITTIKYYP